MDGIASVMNQVDLAKPLTTFATPKLERLLRKLNEETDLPTLGIAIAKVIEITSSGEDSVTRLAHFVLSDVGLTQKILRLSNTVHYRTRSRTAVTTISRSIFLLGFNTVKTSAMAMLLVDFFKDKAQVSSVRLELVRSLCASIIGREMSHRGRFSDGEEGAVAALFKNIGRVLVASFDHQLYEQIQKISDAGESNLNDAVHLLLGCSYENFGEMVLQEWQMPATIIQALAPLPKGELHKTSYRNEWIKQVASFSEALADIVMLGKHSLPGYADHLLKKFGRALEIDQKTLDHMIVKVENETRELAKSMNITLPGGFEDKKELDPPTGLPGELLMKTDELLPAQNTERYPSGKPYNARDLLLAGVQDVTQMLASDNLQINDLILLVLETIYSSMGFRFATVCLRDMTTGRYVSRVAVGANYANWQKGFTFASKPESDLFHLAMSNNVDLMISDVTQTKIRPLLPPWHQALLPDARSLMILPLVIQKRPLGLFYADRNTISEESPVDETALIKTLKNQLLAAMMRGNKVPTTTFR